MTKATPASKTLTFRPSKRGGALVDWRDPSQQANVLDWRQRAQHYGLVPVDDHAESLDDDHVSLEPHRLLEEEEPEAFHEQRVGDEFDADATHERPDAALPHDEVDLVRVYLQHIGKRKLLKQHEEVAIGERIERARADLVKRLAEIPGALESLVSLADRIRQRGEPAAAVGPLAEGGEPQPAAVTPVLKAFARIKRRRCGIENLRAQMETPRVGTRTRENVQARLERARAALVEDLAAQPIRPA